MPTDIKYLIGDAILLRNNVTALTADLDGADLVDARIKDLKYGVVVVAVTAVDLADTNETYVVNIRGRNAAADAQEVLATKAITAAGLYVFPIDEFRNRVSLNVDVGGTTPSITVPFVGIIPLESRFKPAAGTVITT